MAPPLTLPEVRQEFEKLKEKVKEPLDKKYIIKENKEKYWFLTVFCSILLLGALFPLIFYNKTYTLSMDGEIYRFKPSAIRFFSV